jgi:hypothetical protein
MAAHDSVTLTGRPYILGDVPLGLLNSDQVLLTQSGETHSRAREGLRRR